VLLERVVHKIRQRERNLHIRQQKKYPDIKHPNGLVPNVNVTLYFLTIARKSLYLGEDKNDESGSPLFKTHVEKKNGFYILDSVHEESWYSLQEGDTAVLNKDRWEALVYRPIIKPAEPSESDSSDDEEASPDQFVLAYDIEKFFGYETTAPNEEDLQMILRCITECQLIVQLEELENLLAMKNYSDSDETGKASFLPYEAQKDARQRIKNTMYSQLAKLEATSPTQPASVAPSIVDGTEVSANHSVVEEDIPCADTPDPTHKGPGASDAPIPPLETAAHETEEGEHPVVITVTVDPAQANES